MLKRGVQKLVNVFTHGHCFDGLASAVMFTKLLEHVGDSAGYTFEYHGAGYGPGENGVLPARLTGDVTAILDYRFTASSSLEWYFDHHVSAFVSDDDRLFYSDRIAEKMSPSTRKSRKYFHDGAYTSCTKLIADIAKETFGVDLSSQRELIQWADIIDSAAFSSAEMAVERKEPVMKLMTVVEHHGDDAFLSAYARRLLVEPLSEVAASKEIAERYEPIRIVHDRYIEQVKKSSEIVGDCVLVDMSPFDFDIAPKFVTYALYPERSYSVVLTRSKKKCKISIGYNPWSKKARQHNIASMCERYGGGGHPVVGAVSMLATEVDKAKALAKKLAEELSQ